MPEIHLLSFLLAALVAFFLGAFLYSPLCFEGFWLRANPDGRDAMDTDGLQKMGMVVLMRLVQTYVLVYTIHLMALLENLTQPSVMIALQTAFYMWLGFALISHVSENVWKRHINWQLMAINSISTLVMILASAVSYVLLLQLFLA